MNKKFKIWLIYEKRFITNKFSIECNPKTNEIWIIEYTANHFYHYQKDEFEIVNYININDMNDKEIYEGDIVKNKDRDEIYIIKWEKIEFVCFNIDDKDNYTIWALVGSQVEIIGNKYENEELLKGDK